MTILHGCKTNLKITHDSNSDRFLVYIGRESCQYCQIFVPTLYQAALEMEETIFYFYVEGLTEEIEVINFLNNFEVKYTPTLIKFEESGNDETVDFDSE